MSIAKFEIHLTGTGGGPLEISFETAAERLRRLPRLDLEPDGYFVWNVEKGQPWQITGMLYDDGHRLQYIHLHGHCPPAAFDRFTETLSAEDSPVADRCSRASQWRVTRLPGGGLQDLQTFRSDCWPKSGQNVQ